MAKKPDYHEEKWMVTFELVSSNAEWRVGLLEWWNRGGSRLVDSAVKKYGSTNRVFSVRTRADDKGMAFRVDCED